MVTSIILLVVYGKKISGMDNEYVLYAQKAGESFSQALAPGAYWVEFFPFLRHIPSWFPGTSARKLADKYLPYVLYVRDKPYGEVKEALVRALYRRSPMVNLIRVCLRLKAQHCHP